MPGRLKNPFEQNEEEEEPPPIVRKPKPGAKRARPKPAAPEEGANEEQPPSPKPAKRPVFNFEGVPKEGTAKEDSSPSKDALPQLTTKLAEKEEPPQQSPQLPPVTVVVPTPAASPSLGSRPSTPGTQPEVSASPGRELSPPQLPVSAQPVIQYPPPQPQHIVLEIRVPEPRQEMKPADVVNEQPTRTPPRSPAMSVASEASKASRASVQPQVKPPLSGAPWEDSNAANGAELEDGPSQQELRIQKMIQQQLQDQLQQQQMQLQSMLSPIVPHATQGAYSLQAQEAHSAQLPQQVQLQQAQQMQLQPQAQLTQSQAVLQAQVQPVQQFAQPQTTVQVPLQSFPSLQQSEPAGGLVPDMAGQPANTLPAPSPSPVTAPLQYTSITPAYDTAPALREPPLPSYPKEPPLPSYGDEQLLPSMQEIAASMDAFKATISPQKEKEVLAAPQPVYAPPSLPGEVKHTLDTILTSLNSINTSVLSTLTHEASPMQSVGPIPVPSPQPRASHSLLQPSEAEVQVQRDIERLKEKQRQQELELELRNLNMELNILREQQEEQDTVHHELLDMQVLQQRVIAEHFQKLTQEQAKHKVIDKQQRSYLGKLAGYQQQFHKQLQEGKVPVNVQLPPPQKSQAGTQVTPREQPRAEPSLSPAQLPHTPESLRHVMPSPLPMSRQAPHDMRVYAPMPAQIPLPSPSPMPSVSQELPEEVREWLVHLRLERYTPLFARHMITMSSLVALTEPDLVEMGITAVGPRKILLRWIDEWRASSAPGKVLVPNTFSSQKQVVPLPVPLPSSSRTTTSRQDSAPAGRRPTMEELENELKAAKVAMSPVFQKTVSTPPPPAVPDHSRSPWAAHVDPSTKRIYYHNTETKVTQWEEPADMSLVAVRNLNDVL